MLLERENRISPVHPSGFKLNSMADYKIKNYTSTVSADRSVSKIEQLLVSAGANNILKGYEDGDIASISFNIPINGQSFPFKLPSKVEEVKKALCDQLNPRTKSAMEKISGQSKRTAWKLLLDWVEIQVTMIRLNQVEFMEVFMPYLYDMENDRTLYEMAKEKGFQKLLSP